MDVAVRQHAVGDIDAERVEAPCTGRRRTSSAGRGDDCAGDEPVRDKLEEHLDDLLLGNEPALGEASGVQDRERQVFGGTGNGLGDDPADGRREHEAVSAEAGGNPKTAGAGPTTTTSTASFSVAGRSTHER